MLVTYIKNYEISFSDSHFLLSFSLLICIFVLFCSLTLWLDHLSSLSMPLVLFRLIEMVCWAMLNLNLNIIVWLIAYKDINWLRIIRQCFVRHFWLNRFWGRTICKHSYVSCSFERASVHTNKHESFLFTAARRWSEIHFQVGIFFTSLRSSFWMTMTACEPS